jgi:hypothetical protein
VKKLKLSKNWLIFLIIVSLISHISFAKDAIPINKGDQAPFNGILLSTKKAEQVRIELIEKDQFAIFNKALLEVNDDQAKIIKNQRTQVRLLSEQNNKLMNQIERTKWERHLWFGLGVLATGLSIYGAKQLVK